MQDADSSGGEGLGPLSIAAYKALGSKVRTLVLSCRSTIDFELSSLVTQEVHFTKRIW